MLADVEITSQIKKNVREAFATLHAHGVCHWDISPENILVTKDDKIFIIDFESSSIEVQKDTLDWEKSEVERLWKTLENGISC
jgi:tRNA A-37 threonylcarbamoyl transferase component Bud32